MKILLIVSSGGVDISTIPHLQVHHEIRELDITPPAHDIEFVAGSIAEPDTLGRTLDGIDNFITMVIKGGQGGLNRGYRVE